MVNTRSQVTDNQHTFMCRTDRHSDTESESSVPEVLTREQMSEFDNGNLLDYSGESERRVVNQRFTEMTRQINELTNLVLALTEKISSNEKPSSSNREGNVPNITTSNESNTRSDMVTGVPTTSQLPNPPRQSTSQYPQSSAQQFDDIVTEIHHLRDTMTDTVQHPKILHTQVPLFRGNREKYNEFEHLLLNHLRPHQHKLSEEQKLTYFQSLLRDDAIEFWQSLKMTSQTTLAQVLRYFKKEYAKEDLKEVAKYKFDQMRYDPTAETFNDFLNKFKKVAKQAFGDKSSDITETFLFAKLPVQMQNELAMAGKHDASMEEIRTFVQRRCQYAQLIPNATPQPFNQISAPQPNVATQQSSNSQPTQNRETKRKFDGQCRHCGITGHKWAECRKRLREEAQNKNANNQQQPAQPTNTQDVKPKYNPKLVCQICGKVGHSARDCYYRNTGTSAYRSVPYPKQSTEENRQFRRDFKQTNSRVYNANEMSHTANDDIEDAEEIERHDDVEDPKNF